MTEEWSIRKRVANRRRNAKIRKASTNEQRVEKISLQRRQKKVCKRLFHENVEGNRSGGGYWDFGIENVESLRRKALHYMTDRMKRSNGRNWIFVDCYKSGRVDFVLNRYVSQHVPDLIASRGSTSKESTSSKRSYNTAMSTASVSVSSQKRKSLVSSATIESSRCKDGFIKVLEYSSHSKGFVWSTKAYVHTKTALGNGVTNELGA